MERSLNFHARPLSIFQISQVDEKRATERERKREERTEKPVSMLPDKIAPEARFCARARARASRRTYARLCPFIRRGIGGKPLPGISRGGARERCR